MLLNTLGFYANANSQLPHTNVPATRCCRPMLASELNETWLELVSQPMLGSELNDSCTKRISTCARKPSAMWYLSIHAYAYAHVCITHI